MCRTWGHIAGCREHIEYVECVENEEGVVEEDMEGYRYFEYMGHFGGYFECV